MHNRGAYTKASPVLVTVRLKIRAFATSNTRSIIRSSCPPPNLVQLAYPKERFSPCLRASVLRLFPFQTFARGTFASRLFSVRNGTMAQIIFSLRGYSNYKLKVMIKGSNRNRLLPEQKLAHIRHFIQEVNARHDAFVEHLQ